MPGNGQTRVEAPAKKSGQIAEIDKILVQAIACIEAADSAVDLERELIFLLLAEHWMELADQMEAIESRSDDGDALLGVTDAKRTRH